MKGKRIRGKKTLSVLLASLMVFTAVPLYGSGTVKAAPQQEAEVQVQEVQTQAESGLSNIAADCEITVPSAEAGKGKENLVDGNTSTLWVNNGADWPCTLTFALPKANTKCVKKVVLKFESGFTARSVDVSLKYALNNVTSDLVSVPGSAKTAKFDDGYTFEFENAQAMTHLYVELSNPKNNEETGGFWPAIAEAEIYIDNGAEEVVELENIAATRKQGLTLKNEVNTSADKAKITDNDETTAAAIQEKTFAAGSSETFAEVSFGVEQKMRQIVLALPKDNKNASYTYKLYGKATKNGSYAEQPFAAGTINTGSANKVQINAAEVDPSVKDLEYESIKAVFEAENDAGRNNVLSLAEFQILANKAAIAEADTENIVWRSTALHSNYSQDTLDRIVDGNKNNTWSADQYPAYVDFDLGAEYDLSQIEVYTPQEGYSQYSLYYSNDGQNYSKLAEKTSSDSCPAGGEVYQAEGKKASNVRILLSYNSASSKAVLNEVRILGTKSGEAKKAAFTAPVSYEDSAYNTEVTTQDTIDEVYGIVSRNLGKQYKDWFTFEVKDKAEGAADYYEIEDAAGKVKITGNSGVTIANGLNYYLKYYCNVSISQVGDQVTMPDRIVKVGNKVHKECKVALRYAYNYCTMSYSMAFWGEDEWRKELDWLALNGVNVVLDITGQEEVWREFLSTLGYTHEEIKDYIAGPAYYAWAYMANLSGYGGPVHDSWFTKRTELARKNQLIMRRLGMQPILQGYSGMVPVDVQSKAKGDYALTSNDVIPQGIWCSFQRPYMLRTTTAAYDKYAKLFYACQKNVYGDVTHYYATDPFHEGGNTGGMSTSDVSSEVLNSMLEFDKDAVWVIQAWQGNPSAGLINGLSGRKEHALVLDLYAEKDTHWNDNNYSGGKEFQKTPWVYCMLNNFGGRMGLHGHMDNIVSGVVDAANNSEMLTGIGITPEGSQNNPVLYDLLFETVWCDDATKPLTEINTDQWLKDYVTRRYGAESESACEAMKILENTVYKASLNMLGQGAPESYINARPSESIGAASTWGNAVISYNMEDLEDAAELLMEDYDILKNSGAYLYDLADVLKQVLSNSSQKYHAAMVSAYRAGNLEEFTEASDQFLGLIDKVEEVLGTRTEFLFGTWVEQAKVLADGDDDFTRDLYELNAKSLVTTWASYPQAESGGLKDYSNRQWAGLTKDFYKQRWTMWINQKKAELKGESTQSINWFAFEWAFARSHTEYTTTASGKDLKELGEDILENYGMRTPASVSTKDYDVSKMTIKEVGSEETDKEQDAAVNVLDGNSATIWHSNYSTGQDTSSYENHYLVFELEEAAKLDGLRYQPRQDGNTNGIVKAYEIYTSTDGEIYTKAASGEWEADASWKLAEFENPVTVKYVKFVVKDAEGSGCFSSAAEIRLTVFDLAEEEEKTSLNHAATSAKTEYKEADYPAEDYAEIKDLISRAEELAQNPKAKKKDVAKAQENLKQAIENLKAVPQKYRAQITDLDAQAAEKAKEKDTYTAESWSKLEAAKTNAENMKASGNATAKQLKEAADQYLEALNGLQVKKPDDNKPNQTEKPDQTEKPNDNKSDQNNNASATKVGDVIADASGIFNYTITGNDTVEVKNMTAKGKTKKAVKISATIKANGKTYKVTGIAANACKGNKKMTSLTIGNNVTKIGRNAFANCTKLTKVTVNGSKLKTIGKNAFKGDKKLKNISLKKVKSLKKVEKAAFQGISKKVTVKVPRNKKKAYSRLLKKGGIAAGRVK